MFSVKKVVVFLANLLVEFVESRFFAALQRLLITYWLLIRLEHADLALFEKIVQILSLLQNI